MATPIESPHATEVPEQNWIGVEELLALRLRAIRTRKTLYKLMSIDNPLPYYQPGGPGSSRYFVLDEVLEFLRNSRYADDIALAAGEKVA